jgi:hypothetical protein
MFGGLQDRAEFTRATLRVLEYRLAQAISEREIVLSGGSVEARVIIDEAARRVVEELSVFLAEGAKTSHGGEVVVEHHADWRQAFKARWFDYRPLRWLLRKYPVKMTKVKVPQTINVTRMCPHIPMTKDDLRRRHLEFLMEPHRF